jgi:hypothetical protein
MKLRTLAVPEELLLRRFGEEILSVVVPASVSNTEANFKHSQKVESSCNVMACNARHRMTSQGKKGRSKRKVK